MSNGLNNWSFSTLLQYEACPMRVKLKKIDKIPEPPRDPKTDPLERGNREHKRYDLFIRGETDTIENPEAKCFEKFKPILEHARELHAAGQATAEQDWFFDADWRPCAREDVWLWMKLDLCVFDEPTGTVINGDWKTGKSGYKTAEHVQQLQLYDAVTPLKFPWVRNIVSELHYVDEGWVRPSTRTAEAALTFIGRFQSRADKLMSEKIWRPKPSQPTCRYCPYSPRGNGACPIGV